MSDTAIKFENVGKLYRLGVVGTGTLSHDLRRWWITSVRGKEDPYLKIGETNDRATKGHSDYVYALKDINFEVKQGDVLGIIGKNGAGKSTLLKLLSRVTYPTTGKIYTKGRIASLLEVGTGFHPELTGRENIYMNGSILGMRKAEIDRKLDEIVDFSGCERYLDTPTKRYSSGMTVRLGFAIAAHLDPEILVVDEVLAVGDAEFQKKAIGKMQDVSQGEGRTVLFVSHNMDSILNLCKNGILLENGCLTYASTAENVVSKYLSSSKTNYTYTKASPITKVYVSEMCFYGNERQKNGLYYFDESVTLQIDVSRNKKFQIDINCILGIVLYIQGKKMCTTEYNLNELNNCTSETLLVEYPSSLFAPGLIYFEFAIHIPDREIIEDVKEVCSCTILDNRNEYLKYNRKVNGMIVLHPTIKKAFYEI